MICCEPDIFPFIEAVTTINYSPAMIQKFGNVPNMQVFYKEGTQYVLSDDMNLIKFDGSDIIVDHGGPMAGILKVF